MVDLAAFLLLISIFGAKIGVVYVTTGVTIAIIGGTIIQKMKMEKHVESYVWGAGSAEMEIEEMSRNDRVEFAKDEVKDIFNKVWLYILSRSFSC